jgi:hypothetical protein
VSFDDQPRATDVFQSYIARPPRERMIAGAIAIALGVAGTVLLWNRGILWGWTVFLFGAGVLLFFSGITGMSRQKARAKELAAFRARQPELVGAMIEEKRRGGNPVRWMNDHGIHDPEIRTILLEELGARLKSQSSPEDPGKSRS